MNSTGVCGEPYEHQSSGPINTCAWSSGNYSTSAQSAIFNCCGPNNSPYQYSLPNTPPNCFQVCNIKNGTGADLLQNKDTLTNCLNAAGAANLYCLWDAPKASSANRLYRTGASWSVAVVVWLLLGASLVAS